MSLRLRLIAAFAYVLVLVLVALEVPLALNLSDRVQAEIEAEASGQAQLLAASASDSLDRRAALARLVDQASDELRGRVIVVDERGLLIADSAGPGLRRTPYGDRPEVARALDGEVAQGVRHSASLDENLLFTAVPVVRAGQAVGAVRITQSMAAVEEERSRDVLALVAIGAVALLLGLVVAWALAGSLSRPLRELAEAARRFSQGDLEARSPVAGSSEQRRLAEGFNAMAARIGRLLRLQREFVANASHQLRTPLTGLRLRLEAARDKVARGEEADADLAAAERESERLSGLLDDLLLLARDDEPSGGPTSLRASAEAALARWRDLAAANGKRLTLTADGDAIAGSSPGDVAAILDNLVENAILYSQGGARVEIECSRRDSEARLAVSDEGPGIEPEAEKRAFDRFYRGELGRRSGPGTGLGLSIVQELAGRWGGSARIARRAEGGTTAEVTLPLADRASVRPERGA